MDTPTELTAVILEPTHPNFFLICCLVIDSQFFLLFLVLIAWQTCVFSWSLCSPPKALAWSCSPALMFSTFSIISSKVPMRIWPSSFTGGYMGKMGQKLTKVRPSILSVRPIAGTHQWLLNDWVMHADLDFISNCPFKPRQLSHNELFLNEFV